MTGKSTLCLWELDKGPSYWQKPVSLSTNWEAPFQSMSPGAARGVHIQQTFRPNSRSEVPTCPASSSVISAISPRWATTQTEAHTGCERRDLIYCMSTLENKRRLGSSSQVFGSSGSVSGTFQIFSGVSTVQHMARLRLWLETSLQLSCIP